MEQVAESYVVSINNQRGPYSATITATDLSGPFTVLTKGPGVREVRDLATQQAAEFYAHHWLDLMVPTEQGYDGDMGEVRLLGPGPVELPNPEGRGRSNPRKASYRRWPHQSTLQSEGYVVHSGPWGKAKAEKEAERLNQMGLGDRYTVAVAARTAGASRYVVMTTGRAALAPSIGLDELLRRGNPRGVDVHGPEAYELAAFARYSDRWPQGERQWQSVVRSLDAKKKRGTYDPDKAVKAFYSLADAAIKPYAKDAGGTPADMNLTVGTRWLAAEILRDRYESGEWVDGARNPGLPGQRNPTYGPIRRQSSKRFSVSRSGSGAGPHWVVVDNDTPDPVYRNRTESLPRTLTTPGGSPKRFKTPQAAQNYADKLNLEVTRRGNPTYAGGAWVPELEDNKWDHIRSKKRASVQQMFPEWKRQDFLNASEYFKRVAEEWQSRYSELLDDAAQRAWGRKFQMTDYKVSCIGSDTFPESTKNQLREACYKVQRAKDISAALKSAASYLPAARRNSRQSNPTYFDLAGTQGGEDAYYNAYQKYLREHPESPTFSGTRRLTLADKYATRIFRSWAKKQGGTKNPRGKSNTSRRGNPTEGFWHGNVLVIPYHRDLDVRNTDQLPRGTGAKYVEVMEAHEPGVYIAVQWRRTIPKSLPSSHLLLEFPGKTTRRRNPATFTDSEDSAAGIYKTFHGSGSTQIDVIPEDENYRQWTGKLGDLQSLKVRTESGLSVEIDFSKDKVLVTSDPDGRQLYFVGGNQKLDLSSLKMSGPKWSKDLMEIGKVRELTYRTKKKFDDFRVIDYYHGLGEETGVLPTLIYDTLNEHIKLAGGQYSVKPEGIVN